MSTFMSLTDLLHLTLHPPKVTIWSSNWLSFYLGWDWLETLYLRWHLSVLMCLNPLLCVMNCLHIFLHWHDNKRGIMVLVNDCLMPCLSRSTQYWPNVGNKNGGLIMVQGKWPRLVKTLALRHIQTSFPIQPLSESCCHPCINDVMKGYAFVFDENLFNLGQCKLIILTIKLNGCWPIRLKAYCTHLWIRKVVNDMIKAGVI